MDDREEDPVYRDNSEGRCRFLLRPRHGFRILNEISRGAYGVVYRAWDCEKEEVVAMKREFDGVCRATLAEIRVLQSLPRHPSIVEFKRVVKEEEEEGGSTFVVMEYLENDLNKYIGLRDEALTLRQIKHVMRRLVEGVAFLHRKGVMHRDLKPDNILIGNGNGNGNSTGEVEVKICDFGLSAPTRRGQEHSPCVGSRWYRAPELLVGLRNYSSAVDMWAVGCIMAELALRRPLFRGNSDYDQLPCIHVVISPSYNHIRLKMAAEAAFSRATSLTPSGLDLIQRLMAYDPNKRITARDALNHAWFTELEIT